MHGAAARLTTTRGHGAPLGALALNQPVNHGVWQVGHNCIKVASLPPRYEHIHALLHGCKGGLCRLRPLLAVAAAALAAAGGW